MKTTIAILLTALFSVYVYKACFEPTGLIYYCPSSVIVKAYQDRVAAGTICPPLLSRSIEFGAKNIDVTTLQAFLIADDINIPAGVTGYYGAQTRAAVNDFQIKYSAQILLPQGLSRPSGAVRSGTLAQINALHCAE